MQRAPVKPKMSPEEYAQFRAAVARRVNQARGTPEPVQKQIRELYFEQGLTARQVAEQLNITHGAVRSTISRLYASMTPEERQNTCKHGGSWLNKGDK